MGYTPKTARDWLVYLAGTTYLLGLGGVFSGWNFLALVWVNRVLGTHIDLDHSLYVYWALVFVSLAVLVYFAVDDQRERAAKARAPVVHGDVLIVKHTGFASGVADVQPAELPDDLKGRNLVFIRLDFAADLAESPPDLGAALRQQQRFPEQLRTSLQTRPDAALAYCGIITAPFQFLAGYQISTARRLHLFEWNRYQRHWVALQTGPGNSLFSTATPMPDQPSGDIGILIEVSYYINQAEILGQFSGISDFVRIGMRAPAPDTITHYDQVVEVVRLFRAALDALHNRGSRRPVHVFCSAPMSIGVSLGTIISPTLHPPVRVYAYDKGAAQPYPWGLEINAAQGASQIIRF